MASRPKLILASGSPRRSALLEPDRCRARSAVSCTMQMKRRRRGEVPRTLAKAPGQGTKAEHGAWRPCKASGDAEHAGFLYSCSRHGCKCLGRQDIAEG